MPRTFKIPQFYRSPIISALKTARMAADPRKKDTSPSLLDFGSLHIWIARSFSFCFGVENAVEIAYQAIADNPGRRLFMLSEMIHNPHVNNDSASTRYAFPALNDGGTTNPFQYAFP